MASFAEVENGPLPGAVAASFQSKLIKITVRDVSLPDNYMDLYLHEEVEVKPENLSALICMALFQVEGGDVSAIGTNLGLEQKEALIYPLSVLSNAPSMFKSSSAEEMEWIPLFYSETSGRYFYFGKEREILFVMPPKVDDDRSEPVASEGRGRPLTAASSDHSYGRRRLRPTYVEGKGRPMSAAPSDKSHGHRRFRPTRQEGSGRPLSASPGDRRSWDSAYQPSPTGDQVTNRRPNSASVVESSSRFWYSTTEEDAGDDTDSNRPDADSNRPEEGDSDSNYDNDKQIRVTEVDEDEDNDVNIESGGSYGGFSGYPNRRPQSAPSSFDDRNVRVAWVDQSGDSDGDLRQQQGMDDLHAGDGDAAEHYTLDGRDEGGEYAYPELSEQHENTPSESLEDGGTSSDNTDYSNEESAGLDADEESTVIDNYDEDSLFAGGGFQPTSWQSPVPMKARVRGLGPL